MATPASRAEMSPESLERSLRSLSILDSIRRGGVSRETNKSETANEHDVINSETPLPCKWGQCLDLETEKIYFINRSNGMKMKEDRRGVVEYYYSEDEEEEEEYETDDDDGCRPAAEEGGEENVLVVAGCRSCFVYCMVSKQVKDCPKCNRQLLHFDSRAV